MAGCSGFGIAGVSSDVGKLRLVTAVVVMTEASAPRLIYRNCALGTIHVQVEPCCIFQGYYSGCETCPSHHSSFDCGSCSGHHLYCDMEAILKRCSHYRSNTTKAEGHDRLNRSILFTIDKIFGKMGDDLIMIGKISSFVTWQKYQSPQL